MSPSLRAFFFACATLTVADVARAYYDPTVGRFLSMDPIDQNTSTSGYDYCNGDPVNGFDPDGRCNDSTVQLPDKWWDTGAGPGNGTNLSDNTPGPWGQNNTDPNWKGFPYATDPSHAGVLGMATASGSAGMTLTDYQALAAKIGWTGFQSNLNSYQQEYYGATAANIIQRQAEGKDVSSLWSAVVSAVPGVINDSNGLPASDAADLARTKFLIGMGALGGVVPSYLGDTLTRIANGESYPHRNDGTEFQNREGLLPEEAPGYYKEYVVPTPGNPGAGAQRVVMGQNGEVYYTPDHYKSFVRVPESGGAAGEGKGAGEE